MLSSFLGPFFFGVFGADLGDLIVVGDGGGLRPGLYADKSTLPGDLIGEGGVFFFLCGERGS